MKIQIDEWILCEQEDFDNYSSYGCAIIEHRATVPEIISHFK